MNLMEFMVTTKTSAVNVITFDKSMHFFMIQTDCRIIKPQNILSAKLWCISIILDALG